MKVRTGWVCFVFSPVDSRHYDGSRTDVWDSGQTEDQREREGLLVLFWGPWERGDRWEFISGVVVCRLYCVDDMRVFVCQSGHCTIKREFCPSFILWGQTATCCWRNTSRWKPCSSTWVRERERESVCLTWASLLIDHVCVWHTASKVEVSKHGMMKFKEERNLLGLSTGSFHDRYFILTTASLRLYKDVRVRHHLICSCRHHYVMMFV